MKLSIAIFTILALSACSIPSTPHIVSAQLINSEPWEHITEKDREELNTLISQLED